MVGVSNQPLESANDFVVCPNDQFFPFWHNPRSRQIGRSSPGLFSICIPDLVNATGETARDDHRFSRLSQIRNTSISVKRVLQVMMLMLPSTGSGHSMAVVLVLTGFEGTRSNHRWIFDEPLLHTLCRYCICNIVLLLVFCRSVCPSRKPQKHPSRKGTAAVLFCLCHTVTDVLFLRFHVVFAHSLLTFWAWCACVCKLGNVAALRQAVQGDEVGGQEAHGVGGYRQLSSHVGIRHENSVQVS